MDIVSRLKKFMESQQIASSQFADTCNIPRPTISQILNGRNKKISDELISKIHAAFPSLSVMWLMFGEGDMETKSNIEISEPQNRANLSFNAAHISEHELFGGQQSLFGDDSQNQPENFREPSAPISPLEQASTTSDIHAEPLLKTIIDKKDPYKKITSIVVFYDDSTFQTFNPATA